MSRELLARAWAAGAGPGDVPLTIDLDSTICETYGLAKEGARHHGYTHRRGYHPLLAVAAGTGDVLMARLREGQANTGRGAGHFLRETVSRVRYAGAKGQLTMRADSGFYTHPVVRVCRQQKVRFSITVRLRQSLRNLIEAILPSGLNPTPLRCGSSSGGEALPRLPTGAVRQIQRPLPSKSRFSLARSAIRPYRLCSEFVAFSRSIRSIGSTLHLPPPLGIGGGRQKNSRRFPSWP